MKTWKEYPNLFVGKFKLRHPEYNNLLPFSSYWLYQFTRGQEWQNCTLIARKIEDMTDEELSNLRLPFSGNRERRLKWMKIQVLTAKDLIYLLSIGVYPFDQRHFDTGEVIDIKTLED
jgi:hypothetical protein